MEFFTHDFPPQTKKKIYKIDRGAPILQRKKAFSSPHCIDGFSLVLTFVDGGLVELILQS